MPVTMLVLLQQLLVAHPSLPANNLEELIALAKAKPGTINYASYGSGSQPHLSGEMLKYKAGIDLVHVPYKGISLAVPAVMAGEVQLTFAGIATSTAPLKSGRIKPIAIGGTKRSPLLPGGADLRRARLSRGRDARLVRPVPARRLAEGSGRAHLPGHEARSSTTPSSGRSSSSTAATSRSAARPDVFLEYIKNRPRKPRPRREDLRRAKAE